MSSVDIPDPGFQALAWMRVVQAADQLWQAQAADPDDVASWWPAIVALDAALEQCPGTAAYLDRQAG